jgi:hypothetical protein
MVAPLVALAPIATAVGRFAVPYLAKELGKVGTNKFVQTYGNEAFNSLNETLMSKKKEEDKTPTVVSEDETKQPQKQPPPKGPDLGTELATEAAVQATKKVLEDKKPDVSKQTKDLIRGIGDNNPPSSIEEDTTVESNVDKEKDKSGVVIPTSLTTENFLQPKLLDDMLKLQGGVKGFDEIFKRSAPMPSSTKKKMYNVLSEMIDNKYNLSKFPEGESPETVTEERLKYLQNTSSKRFEAIDYIVSAAYDVIHGPTKGSNLSDTIFVTDDEGLPMAAAKIELKFSGPKTYSRDALTITETGSIFRNAGDQLFDAIIKRAKDEGKRFVVVEDLTSPEALEALKKRGFKLPTTKALKPFKGRKIYRPSGRSVVQKNLVLDLGKEIIKEQTDKLLENK